MDLGQFKTILQSYCRAAGYKQESLAKDCGMDPLVFSTKLNGRAKNAPFTHLEFKAILKIWLKNPLLALTFRRKAKKWAGGSSISKDVA